MTLNVSNSANSALVSGFNGLQNASNNITQAASSIAQQQVQSRNTGEELAGSARQQSFQSERPVPGIQGGNSLTDNLVSLNVNTTQFQASAKVVKAADETIGRLIDELV